MARLQLEVKLSLEGVSDGWTEDHFLKFKAFDQNTSLECADELKPLKDDDNRSYVELFSKYAKRQFISGKVLVSDETVDAEVDDIDDLPAPVITEIFELISRSKFADPKVLTN